MAEDEELVPAAALAKYGHNYPNESPEYRRARTALLAEEIELRRHIERVAEQRRALPPGGEIPEDYVFAGVNGPVHFSALFGHHDTLVVYNYMYGPKRERPCPMCTSLLSSWDGEAADIEQRVALAVVASRRSSGSSRSRRSAAGVISSSIRPPATASTRTISPMGRTARTGRRSTSSPDATARSGISGVAR